MEVDKILLILLLVLMEMKFNSNSPFLLSFLKTLLTVLANESSKQDDFEHCEKIAKEWASASPEKEVKEDKHILQDLLFFLHVPRTGGHAFLRKLYSNSEECPRSYDRLRFDPSKQNRRLLTTHDDYSMMSKLPTEKTSVVTILRNPVAHVFSTYEFSIEVAARFLVHPNLTSATEMTGRLSSKTKGVSTLDIWPWKYLVPWMREDLFSRRDARKLRSLNVVKGNGPYNMEEIVMPLQKYISDPIAHDLVHNGATFQVAGLTNNSYFSKSREIRHCVQKHKVLGEHVLQVAKRRLDDMLYVGLTEDHRESATMFVNVVGAQVISQAMTSNSSDEKEASRKSELSSSTDPEFENDDHWVNKTNEKADEAVSTESFEGKENMTVKKLMESYESCIASLRKTQASRCASSLKRIYPANFSEEDRRKVPEADLEQIRSLNDLVMELYEYARELCAMKRKHIMQKLVEESICLKL